jgi:hypothetical protein
MDTTSATYLFCIALAVTYLAARSGKFGAPCVTTLGLITNGLAFFLYALTRGQPASQAAVTALQLSLIFTLLSVGLGYTFRAVRAMETAGQPITLTTLVQTLQDIR